MTWPLLLGGSLRPVGCVAAFFDAPFERVLKAVLEAHEGGWVETHGPASLLACTGRLDPMEAPWTQEVVVACDGWTAYLNNGMNGGDISAVAPAVARGRGWRLVSAQHSPRYGLGHAATQLWIQGPDGIPPLMDVRTLAAHAQDGRWTWHEWGPLQPFERPERYGARRKRDRLDRELLVEYLGALGIRVDEPDFYGDGVAVVQHVEWPVRRVGVEELRRENGW